ncbi:MAG: hypothetical protein Q9159_004174 [Coniocarpon cinnabarinum]
MSASPEAAKNSTSPALSKTTSRGNKLSKLIRLKLSSYLLTQFPHEDTFTKPAKAKSSRRQPSETPKTPRTTHDNKEEDGNDTPNPPAADNGDGEPAPAKDIKRKGVPGPKPGSKRSAPTAEIDGTPKPKGKPGPKKRRIEGENGVSAPAPAPKLGPKANQGAINAQLRALDRTGKPCRRWGKKTVALKSFTGVNWNLPYWQTPKLKRVDLSNDAQSQGTGSSDTKNEPPSSQVASESNNGNPTSVAPNGTPDMNGTSTSFGNGAPSAVSDNVPDAQGSTAQPIDEATSNE